MTSASTTNLVCEDETYISHTFHIMKMQGRITVAVIQINLAHCSKITGFPDQVY